MFMSLIKGRRSIRKFTEREVESEKIDMLLEAALRSPSSRGFNPWHFIAVTNPNLLEKLSKAKQHGSSFLRNAPSVACSKTELYGNTCEEERTTES